MITTIIDANRNGLSRTDNRRPEEVGLELRQSGQSVGRESAHARILGAGQTPTLRDGAAKVEGNSFGGPLRAETTREPAFECLLCEHEAEGEYQGFLAQHEAEGGELATDRQEASAYLGVVHALAAATCTGLGVAA